MQLAEVEPESHHLKLRQSVIREHLLILHYILM